MRQDKHCGTKASALIFRWSKGFVLTSFGNTVGEVRYKISGMIKQYDSRQPKRLQFQQACRILPLSFYWLIPLVFLLWY